MANDFDIAAKKYDATFTFSNIGKAQRNRVYSYVNPLLKEAKELQILELNCGTGEDAIHFSSLGHEVIATDISEGMIAMAKTKKDSEKVQFQTQDINSINGTTFDRKFDLIFSNFGGLNCLSTSQLDQFLKNTKKILTPNGKLILVIMPKQCLWENIYFNLKGERKKANRRNTKESLEVPVDGVNVKTWYYNPKEMISLAKNDFIVNRIKPIGLAIPPSYMENSILSKQPVLTVLKTIDAIATGSFLAKYADHFLIELTNN